MSNNYFDFCENIWGDWLNNQDTLEQVFEGLFKLKYSPEPYLRFTKPNSENTDVIHFLTSNPGAGDDKIQTREVFSIEDSIIKSDDSYDNNAIKIADYYKKNLVGTAKRRINHMDYLARKCGYDNFIQIESIPYHCGELKHKDALTELIKGSNNSISEYINVTKEYLSDKNAIAIQGGNGLNIAELNAWRKLQCEIIGLDIDKSEYITIVANEKNKDSVSMYIQKKNDTIKAICLRAGSNDLPGPAGCDIIANKYIQLNK